ncbi:MAG: hypothetical protein DRI90_02360 [Deltaproteobacteria bacterium]|nr:MAG: hypothetical protein DRI90_02360 [Deltaproteobacteria bacterium]
MAWLTVPEMTEVELAEQIRWEAEQHLAHDLRSVTLGYHVVARRPAEGQMDVVLVAVERDRAARYVEVVRQAGLRPTRCVLDTTALWAWYQQAAPAPERPTAIADLGAAKVSVSACGAAGTLQYWRVAGRGGEAITERLCEQLGLSRDEAEQRKQACGAPAASGGNYRTGYRAQGPVDDARVERVVEEATEELAQTLRRSISFINEVQEPVERVWITGGSERLPRVTRHLHRAFEGKAEPWPRFPMDGLDAGPGIDPAQLGRWSCRLGVALGLCCDPRPSLEVPGLGTRRGLGGWLRSLFG